MGRTRGDQRIASCARGSDRALRPSRRGGGACAWLCIAHAWVVESAPSSHRLPIVGAASVAGKSTALRVVGALSPCPPMLAQVALRTLLRLIDSAHPTLLIDEADQWALTDHRLRRLLASGHVRDGLF